MVDGATVQDTDSRLALYRAMLRIRRIEERIAERYADWRMRCPVHLSIGQEAAAAGCCAALGPDDRVFSGHRAHAHYLARGGDLKAMIAEIHGKATGYGGGKGGSMHPADLSVGFLGAVPIVGSTIPIAAGAALGAAMAGEDRVVMVFFGDGAAETGVFHETLNAAAVYGLPVVFICENNLYSVYTPMAERQPPGRTIAGLAAAHGIPAERGDGNDAAAVAALAHTAVARARAGGGPTFIELDTYRWREHCGPLYDDDLGYRMPDEAAAWRARCPVARLRGALTEAGLLDADGEAGLEEAIAAEIDAAFAFAEESPEPEPDAALSGVTAPAVPLPAPPTPGNRNLTYAQAVREALDQALSADPDVYLMGLGVPDPKGVFGTTTGLREKHGDVRVRDMPLAEGAMTGIAIGSALVGRRPVMSHQRVDFALPAIEQLVNQAAKWRYMFGGAAHVPLCVRLIVGRGWGQGPQHSQSLQAWFAHVPGLKVVMPSSPYDAKGLLLSAIADPDPVIVFEHRWLHGLVGPVPESPYRLPIGAARVAREGTDATVVAASYMTVEALRAADALADAGIGLDVVDLRSLAPLDSETVLASVRRTGRLVVADTGWRHAGFAAEILARVAEAGVPLKAPPARVALADVPVPTAAALAAAVYPGPGDIADAVCRMLGRDPVPMPPSAVPADVPDNDFSGPF